MIEKVQERVTKILYGFIELESKERLLRSNLIKLKDRRIIEDVKKLYKNVKRNEGIEWK